MLKLLFAIKTKACVGEGNGIYLCPRLFYSVAERKHSREVS